jgi:hypothetical protein
VNNEDVEVSIEVTNVASLLLVDICDDVVDSIGFDIVFAIAGEAVDSSGNMTELGSTVDSSWRSVEVFGKTVIVLSLLSVDDNLSSNTSEVVVIILR